MKRTQRNLFIIMTVMAAFYLIVTRLPWQVALGVAGAVLLVFFSLAIWGRDYFIARRHQRKRDWVKAVERFRRHEQKLLKARWPRAAIVLYLSIYSFDAIALTRNNIAMCLMSARDFDTAAGWLRAALQRDAHFALAYVNLAVIAALRNDETTARREMSRAVRLGFSPGAAERLLYQALKKANERSDPRGD